MATPHPMDAKPMSEPASLLAVIGVLLGAVSFLGLIGLALVQAQPVSPEHRVPYYTKTIVVPHNRVGVEVCIERDAKGHRDCMPAAAIRPVERRDDFR